MEGACWKPSVPRFLYPLLTQVLGCVPCIRRLDSNLVFHDLLLPPRHAYVRSIPQGARPRQSRRASPGK